METTAIVNPAITIEKKEYITGENVKVLNSVEATKTILEKNSGKNPIFKVHVEQPVVKSETIKETGAKVIFVQPQFSEKSAAVIAQKIGAQVVRLDPLAEDWEQNMLRAEDLEA